MIDDSELHASGWDFDRTQTNYWANGVNSGRLFVRREILSGNYVAQTSHLCFDFFTGVTAEGLAKWMASDATLARGMFKAHPANAASGVYGARWGSTTRGDTTWRQAFDQLAYADRLCYAIDEQRLMRFWSADGVDAEPVVWSGGGANLGSFIGRRVSLAGEEFLMTGASYDAMTGQVDFRARANRRRRWRGRGWARWVEREKAPGRLMARAFSFSGGIEAEISAQLLDLVLFVFGHVEHLLEASEGGEKVIFSRQAVEQGGDLDAVVGVGGIDAVERREQQAQDGGVRSWR